VSPGFDQNAWSEFAVPRTLDASASRVAALKPTSPLRVAKVRELSETLVIRAFATTAAIPDGPVVRSCALRTLLSK